MIRKNIREKGKKIADKNWVLTAYDELSADGDVSAIAPANQGQAARTTGKSRGKVTAKASKKQGKGKKKVEPGQQADYYSAFAEQYGLDAEDAKKETVANASEKAKEVKGLSNKLKDRYPTSLYLLGRDITDMEEMVANGEVSPKRVERVRSEIKRLKGLLADYERLATPEERSWRHMKAEHPDEIVVVDNGNGLLVVCQEDVKATNKAIGQKLDAPVTENLIVTTNEEQGMPFTTMRVTLADLQRLSDKGVKYVVLDKNGNQAKEERQHKGDVVEKPSHGEEVLRDAVIDRLRESGIEVLGAAEGQKVLDMANGKDVRLEAKRKRALETASVSRDEKHQPTVVSSADGAKILNNLDTLATEYDNFSNYPKTFTGDVAKALGISAPDKSSKYATFETKNGKVVTIRLSNHNAKVAVLEDTVEKLEQERAAAMSQAVDEEQQHKMQEALDWFAAKMRVFSKEEQEAINACAIAFAERDQIVIPKVSIAVNAKCSQADLMAYASSAFFKIGKKRKDIAWFLSVVFKAYFPGGEGFVYKKMPGANV